jgi:hypothetical protein
MNNFSPMNLNRDSQFHSIDSSAPKPQSRTLQRFTSIIGACVLFGVSCAGGNDKAVAQSCNYFAGTAVGGQKVNLNTCSIYRDDNQVINFVYYLGNKEIYSTANCRRGTWATDGDRVVHRPQSQATQKMLDRVCRFK